MAPPCIHSAGPNRNLRRIRPAHSPEPPMHTSLSWPPNYFSNLSILLHLHCHYSHTHSHQDFSDSLQIVVPVSRRAHSSVSFIKLKWFNFTLINLSMIKTHQWLSTPLRMKQMSLRSIKDASVWPLLHSTLCYATTGSFSSHWFSLSFSPRPYLLRVHSPAWILLPCLCLANVYKYPWGLSFMFFYLEILCDPTTLGWKSHSWALCPSTIKTFTTVLCNDLVIHLPPPLSCKLHTGKVISVRLY